MSTFQITVGLRGGEYDGGAVDVSRVEGLREQDLPGLRELLPGARLSTRPGEVGKGTAGPGATLVIEVVERITNDGASLLNWGTALLGAIGWLRTRHRRQVNLDEPRTIAAVAAAQLPSLHERIAGSYFVTSVCLTGGGTSVGTDLRDVWASSYVTTDGWVLVIFSSPSGLVLGHAAVPSEWSGQEVRDPQQVRMLFDQARRL